MDDTLGESGRSPCQAQLTLAARGEADDGVFASPRPRAEPVAKDGFVPCDFVSPLFECSKIDTETQGSLFSFGGVYPGVLQKWTPRLVCLRLSSCGSATSDVSGPC